MPTNINMKVHGLKETQKKLTQVVKDMEGPPIVNAMKFAVLSVQRDARKGSPVNYGQLRASILPEIRTSGGFGGSKTIEGVVGSNVKHAVFMEEGTRSHWPPLAALEAWARRHGTTAFVVARAIARRGLKARKFLQKAYDINKSKIVERFQRAVGNIVG